MNEEERYRAVRSCKWVDEVVEDAPYTTSVDFVDKYGVDFVSHGDDISLDADGNNTYQSIIDAGRMKYFKRSQGVSTTEIVGRMLLLTKDHHQLDTENDEEQVVSPYTRASKYLPTTAKIVQFSNGKTPKEGDVIVYVDGSFDLFHVGHMALLEKAKALGDFLLVGIHSDSVSNDLQGSNFPILNQQERCLSVLACKYVDDVVVGAPYKVTKDIIESNNISVVVHGSLSPLTYGDDDPYEIPKQMGIYKEVESEFTYLTARTLLDRIKQNYETYDSRNKKKQKKEIDHLEKHGDQEKVSVEL
eukprot:TRINITY_DN2202_c1_g1_i1.p1 TRINITY_DN2202_c1_g1~~TRINITY_DN2202_c1_g1_i1.p1  ORF type:complete len:302 (-),score=106.06 TRINITY_DN2202_c1_g1_i1:193-1098(-)